MYGEEPIVNFGHIGHQQHPEVPRGNNKSYRSCFFLLWLLFSEATALFPSAIIKSHQSCFFMLWLFSEESTAIATAEGMTRTRLTTPWLNLAAARREQRIDK